MEKQKRNRVPRGTIDGASYIAGELLKLHAPSVVRRLLTEAGVPVKLIDDGLMLAVDRMVQVKLPLGGNDEAIQPEQGTLGEEVPEGGEPDEVSKPRKPAARRD